MTIPATLSWADDTSSGNAGILDQKLVLEWISENIHAFGGDPSDITIFGESAGGMSVTALMGMPQAKGLFHKAIVQSGAGSTARSIPYARAVSNKLKTLAGVSSVADLRALSMEELRTAGNKLIEDTFIEDSLFGSVVDGAVFPTQPLHAIASGNAAGIPLMTGTTRDETRLWILYLPVLENLSLPIVAAALPHLGRSIPTNETVQSIVESYRLNRADASEGELTHAVASDVLFRMPAIRLAEAQLPYQPNNVFMYRFDWEPPVPQAPELDLGALHGAELGFMFGSGNEGWTGLYGDTPLPSKLTEQMMDAWLEFARTGNPNHGGLPYWDAYNLQSRITMLFDSNEDAASSAVAQDPDGNERVLWDGIPFDGLTPNWAPEDL